MAQTPATRPQLPLIPFFLALALTTVSAAHAQPTLSKVFTPSTIGPGGVSTITLTIVNGSASPVTSLAFTDTLPLAITLADPANASTTCDLGVSGTLTAPDDGSTITLADAQIGGSSNCAVTVDVTASTPGAHTNPAITLSSSAGSSMSLPIDLTVVTTLPGFSKSFAPSSIPLGGRSTLTFTIDNSLNASRVGNLDFTDNLPLGMVIADPANAATDCVSASAPNTTLTAVPGTDVIILNADGSTIIVGFEVLPAMGTCTVTVDVTGIGTGMLDNVTNDLLADFTGAGKASDTLEVTVTPLAIQKTFTDDPVPPGGTVTLDFTIDNFDRIFSATGIAFTDDLTTVLAGLTFDSLLSNDCGGSVSGVGGTTIGFTGGTLAPEGSCTISVSLSVPGGATPGAYTNTTSTVTGTVDGSPVVGNMASEDLFVEPVPLLTKEFLEVGTLAPDPVVNPGDDVILRFTVTNTSTTSGATDITFTDELTGAVPNTGFLPFPVTAVLPGSACGGSIGFFFPDLERQGLEVTGGTLTAAPGAGSTCTIDVTLTIPATFPAGIYTNTTGGITATVDGATRLGDSASDTLEVITAPQLTKSFTDDPVAPGGTVTLEFNLSHSPNSPTDATGITFTDDLAATVPALVGLTANLPPSPDPPCGVGSSLVGSAGDTLLTLMNGTLAPGTDCTFTVTLNVPAGASGTYTNTTSGVSATVSGTTTTSVPSSDDLVVGGMIFDKEFLGNPAFPGKVLTLRFTLENISAIAATAIGFTDSLFPVAGLIATDPALADDCGGTLTVLTIPGTGSFLTYAGGTLAAGVTCNLDVEVTVPMTASDGIFENFVSGVSYMLGATPGFDGPAIDDLIVDSDQLTLFKTFTDDPVAPGDPVTLELNLVNLDPVNAASSIDFTDDLGAALTGLTYDSLVSNDCGATVSGLTTDMITVTGATLAAGGSCTIAVSLTVPGGAAAGLYTNTTSPVTGDITGSTVTGDAASDILEVIQLLDFSKSFDGPTTATGMATLTFTITNPGIDTAIGIDFSDDLDAVISGLIAISLPAVPCGAGSSISGISFLTFTGGTLPPLGGTCSFDVDVLVPASATAGTFPNTTSDLFQNGLEVATPATADLTIEPAPTFAKVFAPDFIGFGLTSTLTFTIDNTASALAASSLAFTDTLPAGIAVATPSVTANTCGGTLTAVAGSGVISLTGGSVAATASCTIDVDVVGTGVGTHVNTTGDLMSSSGNSGTATDTLTVNPQPTFAKAFAPNPITVGGTSVLAFAIDNSGSTVAATLLAFTDTLPAAIVNATPANVTNSCGGTVTAADGGTSIALAGGTVAAGMTCSITVDVTSSTQGDHVNLTGDLSSSLGNSGTATDTLTVTAPPTFAKSFAPNPILLGATSTLTLTIDNSANTVAATGLDFTDNLPAAIVVATPSGALTTCTGGTLTANPGTGTITYTGGNVAAASSCTVTVDVTSAVAGSHVNLTGDLTSSLGNSGTATDTLDVNAPPTFAKSFAPNPTIFGQLVALTFTIDNSASTIAATGLDFTDNLPAAITVATPSSASTTCTGGTLTAAAGTGVITYTGGTVAAAASCVVVVDVISGVAGDHVNLTGDLTSSLGNSGTATDTLTVNPPPTFAKSFAPNPTTFGAIVTLTFTIDNSTSTVAATGLIFDDNMPTEIVIATPSGAATTCTGGTLTAASGTSFINYSGGTVAALSSCTISVDVTSSAGGAHVNLTDTLDSSLGTSAAATDTLIVNPPKDFSKSFAPNPIIINGISTLTFTIDNSTSTVAGTSLDFTDNLPAGLVVATPSGAGTTCTGGTLTAVPGTGVISYTGGTVAAMSICTVTVDTTAAAASTYVNISGDLTSSLGNGGPATDTLIVNPPPGFAKSFAPNPAIFDEIVTLTFTIDNTASTADATALDFTDNLPAAILVATPSGAATTCIGGTLTAVSGTGVITYTGGTAPASASCTVTVDVTSSTAGAHVNLTGDLTSSLGNSGTATDTLIVNPPKTFSKAFAPNPIGAGDVSTLTFTIDNSSSTVAATGLDFTDNMPAGLVVATPAGASTTCTGGILTAVPGTGVISYTGGTVAAMSVCTVSVDVTSSTPGSYVNISGDLTSSLGNGGPATDTLEVLGDKLEFTKTFLSAPVLPGGSVDLEYTIANVSPLFTATDITFTDDFDAVLPGLAAVGLRIPDVCGLGSDLTGTSIITLVGGNLAPDTDCVFVVTLAVPGDAATGVYPSTSSTLTGDLSGVIVSAAPATADLEIEFLDFAKAFDGEAGPGGSVGLIFTLINPDPVNSVSDITFTDDLDAVVPGLEAVGLPENDICGLGSQVAGTSIVTLTGGNLGPAETCVFTVVVSIPADAPDGVFTNVTSALEATVDGTQVIGDPAGAAVADLTIRNLLDIPTLSVWSLLLLAGLIATVAVWRLRMS